MAQANSHNGLRVFSLASADGLTRADIVPELGGTVSSLILPGPSGHPRECLHQEAWFWDPRTPETRGGIPLLFPICGRLLKDNLPGVYLHHGHPFVLPIHGFAMRLPWEIAESNKPDRLSLRLTDSDLTRKMYPFSFKLELHFCVSDTRFSCRLTVHNTGDAPMPYYAGFHPYFATPPAHAGKAQTILEAYPCSQLLYNATKTNVIGFSPPPAFPMSIENDAFKGLLLDVRDREETRLTFSDGFCIRQTASSLFRYRQFYTLPNAPFFCDEPWMAPAGTMNSSAPAHHLSPGQSESGTLRIASART